MSYPSIILVGDYGWAFAARSRRGPERDVVARVAFDLMQMVGTENVHREYRLSPHERVDLAAILPQSVLLVECKGWRACAPDLYQAERYQSVAIRRWRDRQVMTVLVAPRFASTLHVPLPGVVLYEYPH